jgi:glycosyltransferase involved in cell wall biosynthesis
MNIPKTKAGTGLLKVSVVIPSLHPDEGLLRLIKSLELQSCEFQKIVIVDQSENQASHDIVQQYSGPLLKYIHIVSSPPGLSRARNMGIERIGTEWDVALLPDDDVWLVSDAIASIGQALQGGAEAGSGRLTPASPEAGSRISFPDEGVEIRQGNVWRTSIEACYFITPRFLRKVGLYDESLGLGANSPWQSGEGTDLLLRGLAQGLKIVYVPQYELCEAARLPLDAKGNRRRLRQYARGTGRVFARNYSISNRGRLLAKSIIKMVIQLPRGSEVTRNNWQILKGRIEGLAGMVR